MSEKDIKSKKGGLVHDALILFAITVIAALALGFVYELTKDPIAQAEAQAKVDAYKAVFPEMFTAQEPENAEETLKKANELISKEKAYEGVTIDEVLNVEGEQGLPLGWVLTVTSSKGYGGKITMTMGVSNGNSAGEAGSSGTRGMLRGLEILSLSETPGLGMNAKEEKFLSQFKDVEVGQFSLAKRNISGDTEIDAISSATITTTAVTRSVNAGLKVVQELFLKNWNDKNGN
ncbi:MAG: RnfABCDGE type electron transport complex subunit G [Lachnospiraceae bacterium]|nr:RnfABCDGE type electron transport complex subunit G [Lachnospiraceae bacterium]